MSKLLENYDKFGAFIHPNMDVGEMAETWSNDVSEEVKNNYSSITNSLEALSIQKQIEESLFNTYKTAKNTFEQVKQVVDAGSAIVQQQYQYTALELQEVVAEELVSAQSTVLDTLKSSIF